MINNKERPLCKNSEPQTALVPNHARYVAEKYVTDKNWDPLIPDADKDFPGSLVLDFRI